MIRRMSDEDRANFDRTLENLQGFEERMNAPPDAPKPKKVPSWWRGDEVAAASSMQAARDLGYVVGAVQ